MLRVNGTARIEGLHLAAMNWREGAQAPWFSQKALEQEGFPVAFSIGGTDSLVKAYVKRQEAFSSRFAREDDRIFASDVVLAYNWYVSVFNAFSSIRRLGITASDLGLPEDRWKDYLDGLWSCPEEVQACINLAMEMGTRDEAIYMYVKLVSAFSLRPSLGFMPGYSRSTMPLSVRLQARPEPKVEEKAKEEKHVTCCFTVPREVAEWLKGKPNMSRFIKDLIREEMENEG